MNKIIIPLISFIAVLLCIIIFLIVKKQDLSVDSIKSSLERRVATSKQSGKAKNSSSDKIALVIGNKDYSVGKLRNTINDSRDMSDMLAELGFNVIYGENLNQKDTILKIREFRNELKKGAAVGLFYYAGHGIQVNGSNYLIPLNANIEIEEDVETEAVTAQRILNSMDASGTNLNILILDACRDNPYSRGFRSGGQVGLATMKAPKGTIIAYATAPGEVAGDRNMQGSGRNGLYTDVLLQNMKTSGLEIKEMFNEVGLVVERLSNGKQIPWVNTSPTRKFYLLPESSLPVLAEEEQKPEQELETEVASIPTIGVDTGALFPIRKSGELGYIDKTGKIIILLEGLDFSPFPPPRNFSENLAAICPKNGKCGYIDKTGEIVIRPQFECAGNFSEGLAKVCIDEKVGYINRSSKFIIEPLFSLKDRIVEGEWRGQFGEFSEGLAPVKINNKWGYVDREGIIRINAKFDKASSFSDGLALVSLNRERGKHFYIDKTGNIVIEIKADYAIPFSEGLARVSRGGKYGFIDKNGKVIIKQKYDFAQRFSEGLALVSVLGNDGYINKQGDFVIEPNFEKAGSFSEGLAYAESKKDGKNGYIDKSGNFVILLPYGWAGRRFVNGIAQVGVASWEMGLHLSNPHYIDKFGSYIWEPSR